MKKKETRKQIKFKKIRIVSNDFDVVYKNQVLDETNNSLCGQITQSTLQMEIDKNLHYKKQLESIIHEALHAIFWKMGISQGDSIKKDVEDVTICLTTAITCFIRDNPKFIMECVRVLNGN